MPDVSTIQVCVSRGNEPAGFSPLALWPRIVEVQESRGLKEQHFPRLFDVTIVGHQDDGLGWAFHDEARALDWEARV